MLKKENRGATKNLLTGMLRLSVGLALAGGDNSLVETFASAYLIVSGIIETVGMGAIRISYSMNNKNPNIENGFYKINELPENTIYEASKFQFAEDLIYKWIKNKKDTSLWA